MDFAIPHILAHLPWHMQMAWSITVLKQLPCRNQATCPHHRVGRCYFRHAGDIVNAPFYVPIPHPTMNADNRDAEDNSVTAQTDPPVTTQETAAQTDPPVTTQETAAQTDPPITIQETADKLPQMITCGTQTDACDTDNTSTQTMQRDTTDSMTQTNQTEGPSAPLHPEEIEVDSIVDGFQDDLTDSVPPPQLSENYFKILSEQNEGTHKWGNDEDDEDKESTPVTESAPAPPSAPVKVSILTPPPVKKAAPVRVPRASRQTSLPTKCLSMAAASTHQYCPTLPSSPAAAAISMSASSHRCHHTAATSSMTQHEKPPNNEPMNSAHSESDWANSNLENSSSSSSSVIYIFSSNEEEEEIKLRQFCADQMTTALEVKAFFAKCIQTRSLQQVRKDLEKIRASNGRIVSVLKARKINAAQELERSAKEQHKVSAWGSNRHLK